MGVTVREKDGAYWVFICHQGKRKAKRVGDKRAANAVAEIIRAKLTLGELKIPDPAAEAPKVPTFEEVAKEWERHTAPSWKRSTAITFSKAIQKHFIPEFGPLPITDVKPALIEEWWTRTREKRYSRRWLSNLRGGSCQQE